MVARAHGQLGALMHHFSKDVARRLTDRLSPIALPAPYSTRCIPLIASRALSTRNKVNDKDIVRVPFAARTSARFAPRGEVRKVNTPVKGEEGKREKKKNRVGLSARNRRPRRALTSRWIAIGVIEVIHPAARSVVPVPHRAAEKISRRDDARFQSRQPRPTSDGFSNADLAIKTHCQRQRLPHPSDRRWKACQEAAQPTLTLLAWRVAKGWRHPLDALRSPHSALAQKCIFQA